MALGDNLISYWTYDTGDDLTDQVGSNDGTGFSTSQNGDGIIGESYQYDGTLSYVQYGSITDGWSEITVNAWIKPDTLPSLATVSAEYAASNNRNFLLRCNGSTLFVAIGNSSDSFFSDTGGTIVASTWQMVTLRYDGSTVRGYINGVEVASASASGVLDTTSAQFQTGAYNGTVQPFDGLIDEVGVWDRALSPAEITQLYNGGSGLQYPFGGGGGGGDANSATFFGGGL